MSRSVRKTRSIKSLHCRKKVIIREGLNSVVKLKNNIDQYVNFEKKSPCFDLQGRESGSQTGSGEFLGSHQKKKIKISALSDAQRRLWNGYNPPHQSHVFVRCSCFRRVNWRKAQRFLINHLYRVQKLSTCFYEFRHAHNNKSEIPQLY